MSTVSSFDTNDKLTDYDSKLLGSLKEWQGFILLRHIKKLLLFGFVVSSLDINNQKLLLQNAVTTGD